jgi:PII-like signaling protein
MKYKVFCQKVFYFTQELVVEVEASDEDRAIEAAWDVADRSSDEEWVTMDTTLVAWEIKDVQEVSPSDEA